MRARTQRDLAAFVDIYDVRFRATVRAGLKDRPTLAWAHR